MGRAFKYVILGGGTAAGYAAHEFVRRGLEKGDLCIISEEQVAPYERPALSKGYLMPDGSVRLPSFHTCIGGAEERHTGKWYKEHGIELLLGTRVVAAQVKLRTLTTAAGESITYDILIVATGSRPVRLEDFGVSGVECGRICYLRDIKDADKLVAAMAECRGGRAVVIGGGYIGMEATAALVANSIQPTMIFPEPHCMARLFTKEMAEWYEEQYRERGVHFIKGSVIIGFEPKKQKEGQDSKDSKPVVGAVILKDGTRVPADMVVVGVGIRPNTELFKGQLAQQEPGGGLRVNAHLCSVSASSIYVIGDAAAFPLPLYGGAVRRVEHVDHARKSAAVAVQAILSPPHCAPVYDYLPYFYSRVFTLSWQFFGESAGECVLFGEYKPRSETDALGVPPPATPAAGGKAEGDRKAAKGGALPRKFGAYFVDKGRLVGAFLEGGTKEEYAAIAAVARMQPKVGDSRRLEELGTEFALREVRDGGVLGRTPSAGAAKGGKGGSGHIAPAGAPDARQQPGAPQAAGSGCDPAGDAASRSILSLIFPGLSAASAEPSASTPSLLMQASVGVAVAVGITAIAVWHGSFWRKRW